MTFFNTLTFPKLATMLIGAAALTLTGCSNSKPAQLHLETEIPHAQLGDNVVPSHYDIALRMDPQADTMTGLITIDVDVKQATQQIWLHGKHMDVTEAFITQGDEVIKAVFTEIDAAQAPSGVARLNMETPVSNGKASITMAYETPYNLSLNSAYKVERGEDAYIVTQFEPLGAREAFPSFDEPRFKVPFDLSISSPTQNVVYANTPKIAVNDEGNGWSNHIFSTTRPLPTYLIAFGAGPYDVVDFGDIPPNDIRKRPLALRGLTAKGSGEQINYGLKNTAGILEALEGYFGTEYPYEKLDIIAAPDYAFGAMENPGAIVYREYLMLMDENSSLSQRRAYASVHSHEIAHQWFGNLVTPVWWEDIWLNEAYATWAGNKGITLWKPDRNFDRNTLNSALGAMNIDTLSTTRKVREPLDRSENVMDQFDGITYRKGGGVLSMFESFVGEDKFRDGVRLHMDRYKDSVATGDDFFNSIAEGSGNPDVVDAMKSFVDQPGLPIITGVVSHEAGNTSVTFTQSRYAPLGSKTEQGQMWQIPVCAKFGMGDKSEKKCTLMKTRMGTVSFNGKADWVAPNENGAGYYRFSLDTDGWTALLDNMDKLNTREVLTVQDSLEAAFRAGKVEPAVYIKGMEAFAKHPEYDVASKAGNYLGWFYDKLPESSRSDVARLTNDMYAERYVAIAGQDTTEGNLLAPTLAARLLAYGDNSVLRAEFEKKGAAYLGLNGKADKKAVAPNMLSRSLRAAMKSDGDKAYAPLLAMVKDGTAFEKGAALGALGTTTDPKIAAKLRDIAMNDKAAMTGRQATSLMSVLMGNEVTGDATWDWLKSNFDEFVTTRVADVRKPGMPGFARGCSGQERDEAEAFFTSKADLIPGYERSLKQNLESIELCAALKEAVVDDLAAALKARK